MGYFKVKEKSRLPMFVVPILVLSSILSACSGSSNEEKSTPNSGKAGEPAAQGSGSGAKALDPVTLKIYIPGDRPKKMNEVIAEAEKRMASTINAKLDITFIPWSDLDSKTSMALASGESIDLIFDAPWLHMNRMVSSDAYEPLDELLKQYGPNIISTRPQDMWDANKFEGKVYGIPLGISHYQIRGIYIRKDLREKYGLGKIKTFEDFNSYLYKVKENEKGMSPLTTMVDTDRITNAYKFNYDPAYDYKQEIAQMFPFLYKKNNDGKIYNMLEEKDAGIWEGIQNMRKWYEDGIINKDNLAVKNEQDLFMNGKTAAITIADVGVKQNIQDAVKKLGGEVEWLTLLDPSQKYVSDFKQWNFISIPKTSKNKERSIMFLDWANQKENYDLLSYGIEGQDWEAVGKDGFKPLSADYPLFGYDWIWNPTLERYNSTLSEDDLKWWRWTKDSKNFIKSVDAGFTFNPDPVAQEVATLKANSFVYPILLGALDPNKGMEEFKTKLGNTLKKVQDEYQKQLNAYMSKH